uniref:Uncharacterized protein n=1 Tax=Prolemur simus TaxID=1328070 RepID=A0A8C8ZB66_PROSS
MGKEKETRKPTAMQGMLSLRDHRLKEKDRLKQTYEKIKKKYSNMLTEREVFQHPSCLFFQYNAEPVPPYDILVDTTLATFPLKPDWTESSQ